MEDGSVGCLQGQSDRLPWTFSYRKRTEKVPQAARERSLLTKSRVGMGSRNPSWKGVCQPHRVSNGIAGENIVRGTLTMGRSADDEFHGWITYHGTGITSMLTSLPGLSDNVERA